jgi:hypothetical protein
MATQATETLAPSTEIVASDFDTSSASNVKAEIAEFRSGDSGIMSTFTGDDFFQTAKAQLAATSSSEPLSDHVGKTTILLDNFVIQPVEIPVTDNKGITTGELSQSARVTLVDSTNGKSYHGTSMALVNSLKQIVAALGNRLPSEWAEPLPIQVVEEKSRAGFRFFKIVVVL